MAAARKAALSYTGGKDCTLALMEATRQGWDIVVLVTFGPPPPTSDKPKSFVAHPIPLIKAQAEAMGLPHEEMSITEPWVQSYQQAITSLRDRHGVTGLVTGDIMEVCVNIMEKAVEGTGVSLVRPLWGKPRKELLEKMRGFDLVVTACNKKKMGKENAEGFVGLSGPAVVDQLLATTSSSATTGCGERGEFHTMVLDAPPFRNHRLVLTGLTEGHRPVTMESQDGDFVMCDVQWALQPKSQAVMAHE